MALGIKPRTCISQAHAAPLSNTASLIGGLLYSSICYMLRLSNHVVLVTDYQPPSSLPPLFLEHKNLKAEVHRSGLDWVNDLPVWCQGNGAKLGAADEGTGYMAEA